MLFFTNKQLHLYSLQGRSPVDPLIIDVWSLLSESTEKEGDLPSVFTKKERKINTILPAVPTRSAFMVTLYSPGYTKERRANLLEGRLLILPILAGCVVEGGGAVFNA